MFFKMDNSKIICRLPFISPRQGDLYYLRLLLLHVRGATSFEYLRTFNDQTYRTFLEACRARGLLQDDLEWERCLEEASHSKYPSSLRMLFVHILAFCGPIHNASELWTKFSLKMSEDIKNNAIRSGKDISDQQCADLALHEIKMLLLRLGSSIESYGIEAPPQPNRDLLPLLSNMAEMHFNALEEAEQLQAKLALIRNNPEQLTIYEKVVNAITNDDELRIFVDGPGGSGKTFLINTIGHFVKSNGKKILVTCWTGIAAALYPQAFTCHYSFGLSVPFEEGKSASNIESTSYKARALQEADIIVIDEVSNLSGLFIETLNTLLQDVTNNKQFFGKKKIIFAGDFRQTLCVVKRATRSEVINASIKMNRLFSMFEIYKLTRNMRADGAHPEFLDFLDGLGNDTLDHPIPHFPQAIAIPDRLIVRQLQRVFTDEGVVTMETDVPGDEDDLIDFVFDEPLESFRSNKAILTPLNKDALECNEKILKKLGGKQLILIIFF